MESVQGGLHYKDLTEFWREEADLWGKKTLFVAAAGAAVANPHNLRLLLL